MMPAAPLTAPQLLWGGGVQVEQEYIYIPHLAMCFMKISVLLNILPAFNHGYSLSRKGTYGAAPPI